MMVIKLALHSSDMKTGGEGIDWDLYLFWSQNVDRNLITVQLDFLSHSYPLHHPCTQSPLESHTMKCFMRPGTKFEQASHILFRVSVKLIQNIFHAKIICIVLRIFKSVSFTLLIFFIFKHYSVQQFTSGSKSDYHCHN